MSMTHKQLIEEIRQLPIEQRKELLEVLSRSLRDEAPSPEDRVGIVERLRGIAKTDGPAPTDDDLKEDYVRYLTEKYS
jgi:hypothetical protein